MTIYDVRLYGRKILEGASPTPELDTDCIVDDSAKTAACQQLACAVSRHAIQQKRIQAKVVNEENEKYIFRIWLVRIGLDGKEYKETRKVLLENLSGHTAFRTKADEEKWKARQAEKRQALRESKEMAAEENGAEE